MSAQTSQFPNRRHYGDVRRGGYQENWMDHNALVEENKRLKYLLNMETAKFMDADSKMLQLSKDLQETRLQLEKQKKLKEMYINQGKDKKREIETMQKYADSETLSTAKIAFQVQNATKHKKKKLLQKDYEELQVAHLTIQQKFSTELQMKEDKNKALQEELDAAKISYQELQLKYDADVLEMKRQAETLQGEMRSHMDKEAQDQQLIDNLRAELDTLRQQMEQEMAILQQHSKETEMHLQVQLEQTKNSYRHLTSKYEADLLSARNETEGLQEELNKEIKAHRDTEMRDQLIICNLRAELDAVCEQMEQERAAWQQHSEETERRLQVELEEIKTPYKELSSKYEPLQQELQEMKAAFATFEELSKQFPEELLAEFIPEVSPGPDATELVQLCEEPLLEEINEPHPGPELEMPEEALPETDKKTPSAFKRFRHLLGLRKPKSWKKKPTAS